MKTLRIFNSQSRKKEYVRTKGKLGMYVCGITPYDVTHFGHAFTYTLFDVVVRYLRYLGYEVTYVQNLTDIDDDILKTAKARKKNWRKLGEEHTQRFLEDMKWLNNLQPDVYPRATDHIPEMIQIIRKLRKKKIAYEKNGSVYFQVYADKDYGKLSRLSKSSMLPIANERGNNPHDPNKKNPLDFVLWQAKKPGEPSWPSPWGPGRPGWHIECSAMSMKYLGETIDIHGGGSDLKFPHHESSMAQSETATGKEFVRCWMHAGMVLCDGVKMSKSLGNMVFISDLKKKYSANSMRMYLLFHHYRFTMDYTEKGIQKAQKIDTLFKRVWCVQSGLGESLDFSRFERRFFRAMNDDFNTPMALKTLEKLANQILKNHRDKHIAGAKAFLNKAFHILGLVVEYE